MEVEVVLGQVGEDRGREVDRVGAAQLERVRGDLHRAGPVAAVEHLAERPLQVDRLRRGALHLALDAADHALDGAQQPGLAAVGLQQRPDQERGRRLAVGAGDARPSRASPSDRRRRPPPRAPSRRARTRPGSRARRGRAAARTTSATAPRDDRVGREVVAVAGEPGHAEEQRPRRDEAVVVGEIGDLDVAAGAGRQRPASPGPAASRSECSRAPGRQLLAARQGVGDLGRYRARRSPTVPGLRASRGRSRAPCRWAGDARAPGRRARRPAPPRR